MRWLTIFLIISTSNELLQQQLEYTLLKPDCHSWWISKMQSGREDTLEEQYAIKSCFELCYYGEVLREFRKRFRRKWSALFKSGQLHFHLDNAPVHNSILFTDYLTKMGIKTVSNPPYRPDLAPCDFSVFSMLIGCHYETIEEMNEAVTKVIGTLTQEYFHWAFQKLFEWYKCIAAEGDYFERD